LVTRLRWMKRISLQNCSKSNIKKILNAGGVDKIVTV
jgi:hypothetical protein